MRQPLAVLIVEDSEDDAVLMVRELRAAGFDPYSKRVDTAAAMCAALGERPWDLILADYRMPQFSGPLALELLQRTGMDVPFVLVSGTVGEETAVAMMKAGAHDFVLKDHLGRLGAVVTREMREAEVRRRRRWAETALEILAEVGRIAIVDSPDFDASARRAAMVPVPRLADWSIVYARNRGWITDAIAVACRDDVDRAALEELAHRYPPLPDSADPFFGETVRSRTPTLASRITGESLAGLCRDQEQLRLLRILEPGSLMVIPLVAREQLAGIAVFAAKQPGRYCEADLGLASEIGDRIALVVENVRLSRAREEFLSTAIHEIKTPIAVIKTAVQLMRQLPQDRREAQMGTLLARLERQTNRLTRLVTAVLEVSRLDMKRTALNPRPTDLAALIEQVAEEMRQLSRDHRITVLRNDPISLAADPDRIEQVLTNLIDNAIKYSPAGGDVEIESRREGSWAVVSVRDHGLGIPKDKQPRIFERFFRAHSGTPYEHTSSLGVGLYLSRELVVRHGGRMWFESEEGGGSTFFFSLPLAPQEQPHAAEPAPRADRR